MQASAKQVSYLIALYNEVHGTDCGYLSQCRELNLTMRERSGEIDKNEASRLITQQLKKLGREGK
jgi:hypothetical protein